MLLLAQLSTETLRGEQPLPLLRGSLANVTEGTGDDPPSIHGQVAELEHGAANLLPLLRGEVLHRLGTIKQVLTLLGGHIVQLGKAVAHPLLERGCELMKPRLLLEGTLLLRQAEVAVALHPLGKMLLPEMWTNSATCNTSRPRELSRR